VPDGVGQSTAAAAVVLPAADRAAARHAVTS
jgi:hypothetical protein